MTFRDLGLSDEVCRAVDAAGYRTATPIQQKSIPHVLMGRDLLGTAQTGTGKTAAFLLPMIDVMAQGVSKPRMPRALVLEPTRELAAQVADSFDVYAEHHGLKRALVIGGVNSREQEADLEGTCDIIIATPGRLLDLFDRGMMMLRGVQFLVIDEADRMMDMGFIPDVEKIVSLLPANRQTLFFSATMAKPIRRLADKFLTDPKEVEVAPPASPAETVEQRIFRTRDDDKRAALFELIEAENVRNALIFCNRKIDVKTLLKSMQKHGYDAVALHGDMDQADRMATLEKFKTDKARFMVCSDVAARGLDIQGLSHVFNFDVPFHAEDYVHRIGRTGRAGMRGKAFMLVTPREEKQLNAIVQLIKKPIAEVDSQGIDKAGAATAESGETAEAEAKPSRRRRSPAKKEASESAPEPEAEAKPKRQRRKAAKKDDAVAAPEAEAEAKPETESEAKPKPKRQRRSAARKDEAPAAAEADAEAKPKRARRAPKAEAEAADEPAKEPALPNGDGDSRAARRADPPAGKGRQNQNRGDTPKGLGDHVPAFLQRPLRNQRDAN
ncbi:MAG: hypothetical protein TEF_11170 [Rhizobiales bacterium NRL2]|jgi:superfamily II DNA/RNA helicase|nr:MAG: hypothetical protein TEF_11170 [Rhizobiales bacterium NRL2]